MKSKTHKHKKPYQASFFYGISQQSLYGLFAILLMTFLVFSGNLKNEVLVGWDDGVYLEDATVQKLSFDGIKTIFGSFHLGMYQPMAVLTFALNYAVHGENAFGYHLVHLILHLVNTLLVFLIVRKLKQSEHFALFVALLFAIHPMHVEAVSWISTRSNAIFSLFYLLAAWYYLHYLDSGYQKKYLLITVILFVLALFSKSMAMSFPFVLVLLDYYRKRKFTKNVWIEKLPFVALAAIFGLIALRAASAFGHIENLDVEYNYFERLLMITGSLWFYIWKMFLPINLSAIYTFPQPENGLLPPGYYLSFPILAIAGWLLWKFRKSAREIIFGFGLFLVLLAPVLPFFWSRVFIVAERYTYLSYIGLFFVIGSLFEKYLKAGNLKKLLPPAAVFSLAVIWLLILAGTTFNRTTKWRTTEVLLQDVIDTKNSPTDVAAASFYLANLYDQNNETGLALDAYSNAIELNPRHFLAFNNRGILLGSMGKAGEAMKDFNMVVRLKPDYAEGWYNRGILLYQTGKINEACSDWQQAALLGANHAALARNKYCK